jgi:hypothetical protein
MTQLNSIRAKFLSVRLTEEEGPVDNHFFSIGKLTRFELKDMILIKGIVEYSLAQHIVLSCLQRWIGCCCPACRTFRAFLGRIPFEALMCQSDTQARCTCGAWNKLMFVEQRTPSVRRLDPAWMLCTTSRLERQGTLCLLPTYYWLHDLSISHYLRANSLHTQCRIHP